MYLVGLTGGIAAGKSTVASVWVEMGGIEIDADKLARQVVEPNTSGLQEVIDEFGSELLVDGHLDRDALAAMVFSDPIKRAKLEGIIHPRVQGLATEIISKLPKDSLVIYNIPLLVESGSKIKFDKIVTVEAPITAQIQRLVQHRKMTEANARLRIDAQALPAARAQIADVILNSNQSIIDLQKDAARIWRQIEQQAGEHGSN